MWFEIVTSKFFKLLKKLRCKIGTVNFIAVIKNRTQLPFNFGKCRIVRLYVIHKSFFRIVV